MNQYSSLQIAKRLLTLAEKAGSALTPMQLIKLVYICHGWVLALCKRPLIKEKVEAWQYGPVIPELYSAIKAYRSQPVINISVDEPTFGSEEDSIISQVFDLYGHLSGVQLSALTHQPQTPWAITWQNGWGKSSEISNDLIEEHFRRLAEAN